MNDDAWTWLLTMIRRWGLGIGAADPPRSELEPAAGLEVVRRPILVKGQSGDAGPSHGTRYYIDRPSTAQRAAAAAARQRGPCIEGASHGADRHPGRLPPRQAIWRRKTRRCGSLLRRFLALRNRRMGPRLSGLQDRLPHQTAFSSSSRSCARSFNDSGPDGEAASAEPP
jgi:hypothetical protein